MIGEKQVKRGIAPVPCWQERKREEI